MTTGQAPLLDLPATGFSIDAWDVGYGTSFDADGLSESRADTNPNVELPAASWAPIDPDPAITPPPAVLFVDGVRRIDARVWINGGDPAPGVLATAGICASYAAGVVCCCSGRAHVVATEVRRGTFTTVASAADIVTRAGRYLARHVEVPANTPLSVALSSALQRQLAETELAAALAARSGGPDHPAIDNDLLVVDGPLHDRTHLERTVGYIKSHETEYLPEMSGLIGKLAPGQRTPVFHIGTSWDRYSWYLRLPGEPGSPWAGVVRVEASPSLAVDAVTALANLTQVVLGRYASTAYKDTRAPQNLYPIAGLERHLRHHLGDQKFVYRALRAAAG